MDEMRKTKCQGWQGCGAPKLSCPAGESVSWHNGNTGIDWPKNMHFSVHITAAQFSIAANCKLLSVTMNAQIVVYAYNGLLYSNENERLHATLWMTFVSIMLNKINQIKIVQSV